jgi:hypothetical protein
MTKDQEKAIEALRDEGYAIIVWTPEELNGVSSVRVEDRSTELGWEIIDDLRGQQ